MISHTCLCKKVTNFKLVIGYGNGISSHTHVLLDMPSWVVYVTYTGVLESIPAYYANPYDRHIPYNYRRLLLRRYQWMS